MAGRTSYSGGTMGANHPIAWYQDFEEADLGTQALAIGMSFTQTVSLSYSNGTFCRNRMGGRY